MKKLFAPLLKFLSKSKDLSVVVFIIVIMSIIIVPLPSLVLDFLLAISIAVAVFVILISLYTPRPADLTTFPTILLIVTLFRLSLNVATTRLILSEGHNGPVLVISLLVEILLSVLSYL